MRRVSKESKAAINKRQKKFRAINGRNQISLSKSVAPRFYALREQLQLKSNSQLISILIDRYISSQSVPAEDVDNLNLAASLSDLLPATPVDPNSIPTTEELRNQFKFSFALVQRSQLSQLITACYCSCGGRLYTQHETTFKGSLKYQIKCNTCAVSFEWAPISYSSSQFPAAAVVLACQLSGITHSKWTHFGQTLGLPSISNDLWYTTLERTINPLIFQSHINESYELLRAAAATNEPQIVVADMTWDSSRDGCYGVEAFMDYNTKKVLHFEVIPSKDAGRSVHCEVIGFNLGLAHLKQYIPIKEVIYDAHGSIPKQMRERHPDIEHLSTDCWHWVEKTEKKANKCFEAKKKESYWDQLKDKPVFIKKHAWYCLHHCGGDSDLFVKLLSNFVNHVQNDHSLCYSYNNNASCATHNWASYDDLADLDADAKNPVPFTIVTNKEALDVLDKFMKKGIFGSKGAPKEIAGRLVRARHSSELESYFHSCLVYTPKYCHFSKIDNFSALRAVGTLNWNAAKDPVARDAGLAVFERQIIKRLALDIFKDPIDAAELTEFSMANIYKKYFILQERERREAEKAAKEAQKKLNQQKKLTNAPANDTPKVAGKRKREDNKSTTEKKQENSKSNPKRRRTTTKDEYNFLVAYLDKDSPLSDQSFEEIQKKLGSEWDAARIKSWLRNNRQRQRKSKNK